MPDPLQDMLIRDEDEKLSAYQDSAGWWTIGVGHLIDARKGGKIPAFISRLLLQYDINEKSDQLFRALPWAEFLDAPRRAVLIGMSFNMGVEGLLTFKKMLAAIQAKDWDTAAKECEDPDWVAQVGPNRPKRYAQQLRTGVWQ